MIKLRIISNTSLELLEKKVSNFCDYHKVVNLLFYIDNENNKPYYYYKIFYDVEDNYESKISNSLYARFF